MNLVVQISVREGILRSFLTSSSRTTEDITFGSKLCHIDPNCDNIAKFHRAALRPRSAQACDTHTNALTDTKNMTWLYIYRCVYIYIYRYWYKLVF